jgi:Bacterial Ig-like domain (group 3)/FG-GAP-like repeat
VGVLIGNGDGTFQPAVSYDAGGIQSHAIVIGDVDNDTWPDLILTSNCTALTCVEGSIHLLVNKGDGTFKAQLPIGPAMGGPLAIGDLYADGNLDLVAQVGVLLGDGLGNFNPVDPLIGPSSVPGGTISIALADVDGDGNLDVVVADQINVKVQLGNGDGTLQTFLPFKSGGGEPLSVAVADVNGDGKPDVVVANKCVSYINGVCTNPGTVAALSGNGDGTFQLPVKYNSTGKLATSVAVADVNQDTKPDILVSNVCFSASNCAHGNVGVLLNTYTAAVTVQVASSLNPAFINQPFDLTATLTSPIPIPDGSDVDFLYLGNVIGTGSTTNGVATVNVSFPTYGPHTVKATFHGDTWHNVGSETISQMVRRYVTTTTVMSGNTPEQHGQTVALTATVTSGGPSVPTGTVTFKRGTTTLATKTLSGGTATLNTNTLPVGTLTINAFYNGDSQSAPSSGSTTQVIY